MELYTRLPNRLGLHLIDFDQFNHVDFLYSRNVSDLVYQNVINTISTAEFDDWVPVYDKTTSYKTSSSYIQCNDIEINERTSKKKNDGFWSKITSYMKKKEVYPLIKIKEVKNDEEKVKSKVWSDIQYI